GPPRGASSRLNLAQALNSLGTTLGPIIGGVLILSIPVVALATRKHWTAALNQAYTLRQTTLVQGPYIGLAVLLLALALAAYCMRLPDWRRTVMRPAQGLWHELTHDPRTYRHLLFGVLAIFVYVGAEVSIGSFMISYISMPRFGDIPVNRAATFVSLYWMGAMVGRFIGSGVLRKIDASRLLGCSAVVAAALVTTTLLSHGMIALWSVVVVGLFNSIMFPNIFTLGIAGLGSRTGQASSLLVMAIVGGAVIPLLQGFLADRIGVHRAYILPLLCYLYIIFYGFWGSRIVESRTASHPVACRA
ncbi:Bacterial glucose/galactose transporter, partial [mine drainage metagenome]